MTKEEIQDVDLENNEKEEEEKDADLNVDEEESTEDDKEPADEEPSDEQDNEIDYKAEFLKQKAINKRLSDKKKDPALKEKDEVPTSDISKRLSNIEFLEKKRTFGYENGLSPQETDQVFKFNPNPSKKDLENPFVKGGIDELRRRNRARDNTPSSSSHTVTYKGKDVKEVIKDEKASPADKQAAWEKRTGVKK